MPKTILCCTNLYINQAGDKKVNPTMKAQIEEDPWLHITCLLAAESKPESSGSGVFIYYFTAKNEIRWWDMIEETKSLN